MLGWTQILIVIILIILLFGRGKIVNIMNDFAEGIKSFKKGMIDEDELISKNKENIKKNKN